MTSHLYQHFYQGWFFACSGCCFIDIILIARTPILQFYLYIYLPLSASKMYLLLKSAYYVYFLICLSHLLQNEFRLIRIWCFPTKMIKNTIFSIIFVSSNFVVFEHLTSPEWRLEVLYKIMELFLNKSLVIFESQLMEKKSFVLANCLLAKTERR